jgi:hypothetical protein
MGNWALDAYDSIAEAETAIEAIDSSTNLHVFGFMQGVHQKIVVVKST